MERPPKKMTPTRAETHPVLPGPGPRKLLCFQMFSRRRHAPRINKPVFFSKIYRRYKLRKCPLARKRKTFSQTVLTCPVASLGSKFKFSVLWFANGRHFLQGPNFQNSSKPAHTNKNNFSRNDHMSQLKLLF